MSNKNFFNGLNQIGRNNLEGWMKYMEQMVPALAEGVVNGMTLDKILKGGMPQLSKVMTGANLNTLTDYMYYMVDNPLGTPPDVTGTKVFLLVVGARKSAANSNNPDMLQLLYTLTPTFALHYRVGKLQDINSGAVPWINYRTLLKGDAGLNSFEFWLLSNPSGTEQDYWDSLKIKGDKGDVGDKGDTGLSAYEEWVSRGGIGTFEDFLSTLRGADAPSNFDEWLERNPGGTYAEFAEIYQGFRGWTPLFATEPYGDKVLLNLYDWQGTSTDNDADKPTVGYISAEGVTQDKDLATDFRGMQGLPAAITGASAVSLPTGSMPTVSLGGTSLNRTFVFGIPAGERGFTGADGKSAYQFWLEEGNTGSIQDFIASFGEGIAVVPPKVYWGSPITGDKKLTSADIGLSFLITADAEIEMPDWNSIDSGWYVHLYPDDFGKKSSYDMEVTTEAGQTIRGELGKINGDVTVIRSPNEGEFIIYGEVTYVAREDLQNLVEQVLEMDWTNYWYPNWFPSVQVALSNAQATLANLHASAKEIGQKYNALYSTITSLGIRIAIPKPYDFHNGDWEHAQNFSDISTNPTTLTLTFTHLSGVNNGAAHAEQPEVALNTIDQVLNNPALIPASFADGTAVFSKFNEVPRNSADRAIGFEFSTTAPKNYNNSVTFRGEVWDKDETRWVLEAEVGTVFEASTVKLLTAIRAIKYVGGVEDGRDEKIVKTNQTYTSGAYSFGLWYSPTTQKVHFLSGQTTIELDDFDTNDVSSGKFSTAFPKIDSFGLALIRSTKLSGSVNNTVKFERQNNNWTLDFPGGVEDTTGKALIKYGWVEPVRSMDTEVQSIELKVVTEVNVVEPPVWNEPSRSITTEVDSMNLKIVTPVLVRESTWTEPARTTTTTVDAISLKIVTVNQ